jgi:hypothetical protein
MVLQESFFIGLRERERKSKDRTEGEGEGMEGEDDSSLDRLCLVGLLGRNQTLPSTLFVWI